MVFIPPVKTRCHLLSEGFIAVKRRYDHSDPYKGKHLTGAGVQFRGPAHCHHDGMKADMALEKELRVQHFESAESRTKE